MVRNAKPYDRLWLTKGIHQKPEQADPRIHCADARNVWAPDGRVEARPGYRGVGVIAQTASSPIDPYLLEYEYPDGTFNVSPGTLTEGGRYYLGLTDTAFDKMVSGINDLPGAFGSNNTNDVFSKLEYYNSSGDWQYIAKQETVYGAGKGGYLQFPKPNDWAKTTIDGVEAYWVRLRIYNDDFASLSVSFGGADVLLVQGFELVGLFSFQYPAGKRYLGISIGDPDVSAYANNLVLIENEVPSSSWAENKLYDTTINALNDEPASAAVVPQFNEAFVTFNHKVYRTEPGETPALATVEDQDFAVGTNAPYDPESIAWLNEFPKAKYLEFFEGRLWAANLEDEKYTVRWSAPQPYHKVWPTINKELLMENDNSPITGMKPLGEYMIIYKQDSIWAAYDTGIGVTGEQTFAIKQVVAGTGCVSNSSIKEIRGNHIFLAEDGVYSFDGQRVQKLTPNLDDTIRSISPASRPFAAAAHWRNRSCYILSVDTDGDKENDLTLVYDYDEGAWWLWDNIPAQAWMEDEGGSGDEVLYFGDASGGVYQFGVGQDDHGATITSYVETHRLNYNKQHQVVRDVDAYIVCTNKTRQVDVKCMFDDVQAADVTAVTQSYTDSLEKDWTSFSYASGAATDDNWTNERRRGRGRFARANFDQECDWYQLRITHNQKYQKFKLSFIEVGHTVVGRS